MWRSALFPLCSLPFQNLQIVALELQKIENEGEAAYTGDDATPALAAQVLENEELGAEEKLARLTEIITQQVCDGGGSRCRSVGWHNQK
jgi:hypothetical protein